MCTFGIKICESYRSDTLNLESRIQGAISSILKVIELNLKVIEGN